MVYHQTPAPKVVTARSKPSVARALCFDAIMDNSRLSEDSVLSDAAPAVLSEVERNSSSFTA